MKFEVPQVESHWGYSIRPAPPSIGWTGRRPLVPHRVALFLLLLHERAHQYIVSAVVYSYSIRESTVKLTGTSERMRQTTVQRIPVSWSGRTERDIARRETRYERKKDRTNSREHHAQKSRGWGWSRLTRTRDTVRNIRVRVEGAEGGLSDAPANYRVEEGGEGDYVEGRKAGEGFVQWRRRSGGEFANRLPAGLCAIHAMSRTVLCDEPGHSVAGRRRTTRLPHLLAFPRNIITIILTCRARGRMREGFD